VVIQATLLTRLHSKHCFSLPSPVTHFDFLIVQEQSVAQVSLGPVHPQPVLTRKHNCQRIPQGMQPASNQQATEHKVSTMAYFLTRWTTTLAVKVEAPRGRGPMLWRDTLLEGAKQGLYQQLLNATVLYS
jgi:hypothetical protein